jgi:hypothetical protein
VGGQDFSPSPITPYLPGSGVRIALHPSILNGSASKLKEERTSSPSRSLQSLSRIGQGFRFHSVAYPARKRTRALHPSILLRSSSNLAYPVRIGRCAIPQSLSRIGQGFVWTISILTKSFHRVPTRRETSRTAPSTTPGPIGPKPCMPPSIRLVHASTKFHPDRARFEKPIFTPNLPGSGLRMALHPRRLARSGPYSADPSVAPPTRHTPSLSAIGGGGKDGRILCHLPCPTPFPLQPGVHWDRIALHSWTLLRSRSNLACPVGFGWCARVQSLSRIGEGLTESIHHTLPTRRGMYKDRSTSGSSMDLAQTLHALSK